MLRILHIVNDLIRGGTEGQCARTVIALNDHNKALHRVAVFRRQGFFLQPVEDCCGPVYEIPIRHLLRLQTLHAIWTLRNWMRREQFDLVHTWDAESTLFGGAAARLAGIPLITSRRDLGQIYPRWKTILLHRADHHALKTVVNARMIARHFEQLGLPADNMVVIPNIVDIDEMCPPSSQVTHFDSPITHFVYVSRMDPEKDHASLLRALAQLLRQEHPPEIQLHLVGDGQEHPALKSLAQQLQLTEQIQFLGERTDIPQLLSRMDAGILIPSSNEGLSNSILEYMAAGLPVLCTDCGGNTELVLHGETGLVVPIGDIPAMASALHRLCAPDLRARLGTAGKLRIQKEFAKHTVLAQFEALYIQAAHTRLNF